MVGIRSSTRGERRHPVVEGPPEIAPQGAPQEPAKLEGTSGWLKPIASRRTARSASGASGHHEGDRVTAGLPESRT